MEPPSVKQREASPPPSSKKTGSKKYDDFMKFMENIEEEMGSQYEKSSQRPKKEDPILDLEESLETSSYALRT